MTSPTKSTGHSHFVQILVVRCMDHGCDMRFSSPSRSLKSDSSQPTPFLSRKISRLVFSIDHHCNGTTDFPRHLFSLLQNAPPSSPSHSLSSSSWSSFYRWRLSETLRSSVLLLSSQMPSSSPACFISLEVNFPRSTIGVWRRFGCSIREISLCSLGKCQLPSGLQFLFMGL